ncbi:hypothetical protein OG21DRAFT_1486565 [Imleria badia]|nr:hypothetical protein OG21DRAFT_1486565 [Imleria badia]
MMIDGNACDLGSFATSPAAASSSTTPLFVNSAEHKPRTRWRPSVLLWSGSEPLLPDILMHQRDLMMRILHNAKERTLQNILELSQVN